MTIFVLLSGSYLFGSISFALLLGKLFRDIDIRDYGSGNLGATNAIRVLGVKIGVPVLLLDALKGYLCVYIAFMFTGNTYIAIACGIVAVIGHCFPFYLRFSGGKGVATGTGVLIALLPEVFLYALGVWLVMLGLTRYVSLASLICALFVTIFVFLSPHVSNLYLWAVIPGTCFIFFRHRKNIRRIIDGTEAKIRLTRRKEGDAP